MLKQIYIFFLGVILVGCAGESSNNSVEESEEELGGTLYVNEYGSIRLIEEDDSTMRTIFQNNDGYELDTVMKIDNDFKLTKDEDGLPFLSLETKGIQMHESYVEVFEFTSLDMLGALTKIPHLYERPFFKTEVEIVVEGDVSYKNRRHTDRTEYLVNNINTGKSDILLPQYVIAKGMVSRLKNVSEEEYYLLMENVEYIIPENQIYKGTAINLSNGEAAIVWEFADSEAYILENHEPWTLNEVGKEIEVEGYLIQNYTGSFLKNWKIIN